MAGKLDIYEAKDTATGSTWRDILTGYTPVVYPTGPSMTAWVRASFIRLFEGMHLMYGLRKLD